MPARHIAAAVFSPYNNAASNPFALLIALRLRLPTCSAKPSCCPVEAAAKHHPNALALLWHDEAISWAALDAQVRHSVAALRLLGVRRGQRVIVASWNRPELVSLFFALGRLGAALVPLNMRLSPAECAQLIAAAQPAQLLQLPLPSPTKQLRDKRPAIVPTQVAAVLFTSGTTGQPSPVALTHGNFIASAEATAQRLGASPRHRWLAVLPLFHVGGLAMVYRCARAASALLLEAHFDVARMLRLFEAGMTHASLVPTMLERLLDARGNQPFTNVEAVLVGGGPVNPQLLQRARSLGLPVLHTYGLTQAASQVTTESPAEADGYTAGKPLQGLHLRIVDVSGHPLPPGEIGEIQVSGPTIAPKYLPWLATKDLGFLDGRGRLTVVSRRVDIILTGGENVYPAEVEAVMRQHPAIRDVAVVPRPHATLGQEVVAVVVLSHSLEDEALTAWLRQRIAHFKVPRVWLRSDTLPRNAAGKLQRQTIQHMARMA